MKKHFLTSFLVFLLNCTVFTVSTQAEVEIEPNSSLAEATPIVVESGASIDGSLFPGDMDFYSFYGMADDKIDVDIDNGIGGTASVNTYVAIFDQDGYILRANDDSASIDEGSISTLDSYIQGFVIPKDGNYTIGVTNYSAPFADGGTVIGTTNSRLPQTFGDYQLNITYTSFRIRQVAIRVFPGRVRYRPVDPKKTGIVNVAILSSAEFSAPQMVIPSSLTFGSTGNEAQNGLCRPKDVNRDTYKDLLCKFNIRAARFTSLDDEATLRGSTIDGGAIEGRGYIKLVKHHHSHHEEGHRDRRHYRDDD